MGRVLNYAPPIGAKYGMLPLRDRGKPYPVLCRTYGAIGYTLFCRHLCGNALQVDRYHLWEEKCVARYYVAINVTSHCLPLKRANIIA